MSVNTLRAYEEVELDFHLFLNLALYDGQLHLTPLCTEQVAAAQRLSKLSCDTKTLPWLEA